MIDPVSIPGIVGAYDDAVQALNWLERIIGPSAIAESAHAMTNLENMALAGLNALGLERQASLTMLIEARNHASRSNEHLAQAVKLDEARKNFLRTGDRINALR